MGNVSHERGPEDDEVLEARPPVLVGGGLLVISHDVARVKLVAPDKSHPFFEIALF